VWDYSARKPALSYISKSDDGKQRKRSPVSLRLSARHRNEVPRWDGIAMMQWLGSLGVDLRASDAEGITLLHIAVESGDIAFIRWLLAQGLDPSAADEDHIPPMGYTNDEEIVLTLLEGGARAKDELADTATEENWTRVLAWLQAHRAK
jgi:ankyrin repeat protein